MRHVIIKTDGNCLGDTVAFFPYFEEYRKKHNVRMTVLTSWGALFDQTYPEIQCLPWNTTPLPPHDQLIQMVVEMVYDLAFE